MIAQKGPSLSGGLLLLLFLLLTPLLMLSGCVKAAAIGANQTTPASMMINCVQSAQSDTNATSIVNGRPPGHRLLVRHLAEAAAAAATAASTEAEADDPSMMGQSDQQQQQRQLNKKQQIQEEAFQRRLMELKQKYMTNRAISDRAYHILLVIYSLFILLGTVSNSLICLTVILKPKILSPRNIFIVNLAGSDLLLCVFTMPFSFIEISMKMWQMGLIPCKLVAGLQATSIFVSTISITAIALDRYKVIVYPTHQEATNNTRGAVLLLASVWIGALLLSLPLFRFRTVEHLDLPHKYDTIKSIDFCIEDWPFAHGRGIYSVISMMFQYVLPITIVSVVYAKISDKLQKRLIRRQRLTQLECQQKRQLNLIRRTHTMLISVSLIFGLSWLPLNLLNVIGDFTDLFRGDDQLFRIVFAICHLIGCSSACSNPILYGYLNENFRKEFHQVYTHHMHRIARCLGRLAARLPCCGRWTSGSYLPATPTSCSSSSAQSWTSASSDSESSGEQQPADEAASPPPLAPASARRIAATESSAGSRLGTTMRLCWCTSGSSSTETLGGGPPGTRRRSSRLASVAELPRRSGKQSRRLRCDCQCHLRQSRSRREPKRLMSIAAEQEMILEESGGLFDLFRETRRRQSSSIMAPEQPAGRRVWLRCWPSSEAAQVSGPRAAEALNLGQVRQFVGSESLVVDKERQTNGLPPGPQDIDHKQAKGRRRARHCTECKQSAKAKRGANINKSASRRSSSNRSISRKIQGLQIEPPRLEPADAAAEPSDQAARLKSSSSEQQITCYLSVETARRKQSNELSRERSTSLLILDEQQEAASNGEPPPPDRSGSPAGEKNGAVDTRAQYGCVIGLEPTKLDKNCCKQNASSFGSSSSSASSFGCILSESDARELPKSTDSLGSCTCSLTTTPTTGNSSACQLAEPSCPLAVRAAGERRPVSPAGSCSTAGARPQLAGSQQLLCSSSLQIVSSSGSSAHSTNSGSGALSMAGWSPQSSASLETFARPRRRPRQPASHKLDGAHKRASCSQDTELRSNQGPDCRRCKSQPRQKAYATAAAVRRRASEAVGLTPTDPRVTPLSAGSPEGAR